MSVSIASGSRFCQVLNVPLEWEKEDWKGFSPRPFYRRPAAGEAILFTVDQGEEFNLPPGTLHSGTLSAYKYRIVPALKAPISLASEEEWRSAQPFERAAVFRGYETGGKKARIDGDEPKGYITRDDRIYQPNGTPLQKSGDIWMAAYVSPGGRYTALLSFNGWYQDGQQPVSGASFIDIYNLATSREVARLKGRSRGMDADAPLHALQWISDRDLVLPFGNEIQHVLTCHFD